MTVIRLETGLVVRELKGNAPWFYAHAKLLSDQEMDDAVAYIKSRIPNVDQFFVGQLFGGVWAVDHPPLEPIYNMFCNRYPRADPKTQEQEAAKFLGILVLKCQIESEETWYVYSSDITNREYKVNTYFKSKT